MQILTISQYEARKQEVNKTSNMSIYCLRHRTYRRQSCRRGNWASRSRSVSIIAPVALRATRSKWSQRRYDQEHVSECRRPDHIHHRRRKTVLALLEAQADGETRRGSFIKDKSIGTSSRPERVHKSPPTQDSTAGSLLVQGHFCKKAVRHHYAFGFYWCFICGRSENECIRQIRQCMYIGYVRWM